MTVIMFQNQFAPKVSDGSKLHTIRGERKRAIKVGDSLSLRQWTGAAYRSKQRILKTTICTRIESIRISYSDCERNILLGDRLLIQEEARQLAVADGFSSIPHMMAWFEETHGLPFHGVLIGWESA